MIGHMHWAAISIWSAGQFWPPAFFQILLKSFTGRPLVLGFRSGSVLQVFLLSGLRLENAAAEGPQTSLQAQPYQQTNQVLRFGIGAGLLLAIGLGQAGSCTCLQLFIKLLYTGVLLAIAIGHAGSCMHMQLCFWLLSHLCCCAIGCCDTLVWVAGCKMLCAVLGMWFAKHY